MAYKNYPNISQVLNFKPETINERPLFSASVSAGLPSPADDNIEEMLDLNTYLIRNTDQTFFVRVSGDSMIAVGIHHDDILIVDSSIPPKSGDVVIAVIDSELTVKRLEKENSKIRLIPENPDYDPIEITEDIQFEIYGVATSVIHSL